MQLQPSALRPLFDALKVEVETYLLIELRHEECSMAGLVAGVRLIPRWGLGCGCTARKGCWLELH